MKIYLNDREIEFASEAEPTVAKLAELHDIKPQGTAIAVNNKVVRKQFWGTTLLASGDKVSVVKIAFGG